MHRSKPDRGWDTAWVDDDDEDAEEDEEEEGAALSQQTLQKNHFVTAEVLGDATRRGLSDIEEEDFGFDDHGSGGYEEKGYGAREQGAGEYEDSEREGSALDPAFLRPTGPDEDEAHDADMGPPDATPTRNVRWQTDDEEEEAGGLEEWRDGEEQPRLYTDPPSVHSRSGQSNSPRRGSRGPCVSIMCRVRPSLPHEQPAGGKGVVSVSGKGRIVIANPQVFGAAPEVVVGAAAAHNRLRGQSQRGDRAEDWARAFEFDRCFWSASPGDGHFVDQKGLYVELGHNMATHALLHGVDVALFAYGASQSGKTHSLLGPEQAVLEMSGSGATEQLGLLPRLLLAALQHVSSGVVVSLSAVELHSHADNSGLRDLLLGASSPSSPSPLKGQTRRPGLHSNMNSNSSSTVPLLRVREHPEDGPFVENLSVLHIHDTRKLQQVLRFLRRSLRLSDGPCHILYTLYLDRASGSGLSTTRVQCVELAAPSDLATLPHSPRRPTDPFARGASPPSSPRASFPPFFPPSSPPRSPSTRQAPPSRTLPHTLTLLSRLLRSHHDPSSLAPPTPRSTPLTWLLSRTLQPSPARPSRCYLLLCLSPSAHDYADSLQTLKYGQDVCAPQAEEALIGREGTQDGMPHYGVSPIREADAGDWRLRTTNHSDKTEQGEGVGPSLLKGLSSDKACVRQVLKETVTDPQQRLARLQRALVAEEQGGRRQTASQTTLSGVEVVSRSCVPSSEEVWALKAKVQHLTHDLQCAVLDRDVALSEARSAHDELKRVRGKEVKAAHERARKAESKLAVAVEHKENSDARARRVQEERDYVRQLLEDTKARHLTQLQALEHRRVEAETRAAHADPTPAGTTATPSHAQQAEVDSLQSRVLRAEAECEEARSLLWDHKAALTQLTHAKIEVETQLSILTEELEATRAKLQQQSRALFALQKQHATSHPSPSTHKTIPPPASACPRASPPPLLPSPARLLSTAAPLDPINTMSTEATMTISLGASDRRTRQQLACTDVLSPSYQPTGVDGEMSQSSVEAGTSEADPMLSTDASQSQRVVEQLDYLEVQQEPARRRPSPLTTIAQAESTPRLSPSPLRLGQPSPTPWQPQPSPKHKQPLNGQKKQEPPSPKTRLGLSSSLKSPPPSRSLNSPQLSRSLKSPIPKQQAQPLKQQTWGEVRPEEGVGEGLQELKESLRLKDSIILQQSHEARTLAETLQRRVMSLERVAVLEGAALKEGLRREARTLSRELRGWTGRHGKDDTDAHPNHTAAGWDVPAVATPGSQAAASGSAYDVTSPPYDVSPPRQGEETEALIASLQDTVASLTEDKARLEERVSSADQRAAKAMEEALVEVLMGVKDENARVREAVSTLGQDKQRAEQRLQELQQKQGSGAQDYGLMFRKELAALWVTLKGDGQQEQAIRQMHKEMETLRAKTQRLGKENAGLKQELAATTRTQLSPARTHAHFSKTQGLHSSPPRHAAFSSPRPYSTTSDAFPQDDASVGTHHTPKDRDGPMPPLSMPKDFSSVMAAACLDDPDAIEQAVQFEIELALQSLLASRRAEAASHSQRDARRPPPPNSNNTDATQSQRDRRPPPPPPDTPSSGDWDSRETVLGRKRKQRPSVTGGANSGAVTQVLASTGGGGESRRGVSNSGHTNGLASTSRSQTLRQEASDKRPPAVGSKGHGTSVRGNWAVQSYPSSAPAGRAGADRLSASVPRPR